MGCRFLSSRFMAVECDCFWKEVDCLWAVSDGWEGAESDSSRVGEEFTSSRVLFHFSFIMWSRSSFSILVRSVFCPDYFISTVLAPRVQQ